MRTSTAMVPIRLDLKTILMYKIECFDSVTLVNDTGDVDLVRALRDHLDVDITGRE
jgi:hypothetical protein